MFTRPLLRIAVWATLLMLPLYLGKYTYAQSTFIVELEEITFEGLPGVQSYAWGKSSDGKWLILGGRRDGLHKARPFDAFEPQYNNTTAIVIDVDSQKVWTADLSILPTPIFEQLQSTNPEFVQVDSLLFFFGGYGYSASQGDFITHDGVVIIHVDSVVNAIIQGKDFRPYFTRLQDPRLAVTGGQAGYLNGFFYIMGGQKFTGRYNPMGGPTFTQEYTNAIRKFRIVWNGNTPTLADYTEFVDPQELHRRDYNAAPQVFPDGSIGFTMFTGVFQYDADLPWLNTVDVFEDGYQPRSKNIYLSHYHSAKVPIWDSAGNLMHTIFFGGIAQYTMDQNGNLIEDPQVPFVRTISKVTRDAQWNLYESKLDIEMPGFLGAGAEFIPAHSAEHYYMKPEILVLDRLTPGQRTLIGYIYGGIESTAPNIFFINDGTQSWASNRLFAVYITREQAANDDSVPLSPQETPVCNISLESIQIFPNPVRRGTPLTIAVNDSLHPACVIQFHLALYTLAGQRMTRLVNTVMPITGAIHLQTPTQDLAAGFYFLSLSTQNEHRVLPILVIP